MDEVDEEEMEILKEDRALYLETSHRGSWITFDRRISLTRRKDSEIDVRLPNETFFSDGRRNIQCV